MATVKKGYKTLPISCVFVVLKSMPIEENVFNNSGLYFHPPTTIINSKNITPLIIRPIGM